MHDELKLEAQTLLDQEAGWGNGIGRFTMVNTEITVRAIMKALARTLPPANTEADVERVAEMLFRAFMASDTNKLTTTALPDEWPRMLPSYRAAWTDFARRSALSLTRPAGGEEVERIVREGLAEGFNAGFQAGRDSEKSNPPPVDVVWDHSDAKHALAALTKPPALPKKPSWSEAHVAECAIFDFDRGVCNCADGPHPGPGEPPALPKEGEEDKARLDWLNAECADVQFFAIPTGGDDADVGVRIVGHFQGKRPERVLGEVYVEDVRKAIDVARAAVAEHGIYSDEFRALSSLPVRSGEVDGLAGRFRDALERIPWVADRVRAGQQFNAYERASNDEDDEDEDLEFRIGIGPVTDFGSFADVTGRAKAELIEAALKIAALATPQQVKEGDRHG